MNISWEPSSCYKVSVPISTREETEAPEEGIAKKRRLEPPPKPRLMPSPPQFCLEAEDHAMVEAFASEVDRLPVFDMSNMYASEDLMFPGDGLFLGCEPTMENAPEAEAHQTFATGATAMLTLAPSIVEAIPGLYSPVNSSTSPVHEILLGSTPEQSCSVPVRGLNVLFPHSGIFSEWGGIQGWLLSKTKNH